MKRKSPIFLLLLAVLLWMISTTEYRYAIPTVRSMRQSQQNPECKKRPSPENPALAQLEKSLSQMEYNMSFDSSKRSLQSPNRIQNLRAYYGPGILTVQNRIDSKSDDFKLTLRNQGIYADGRKLYIPQFQTKTIQENNQLEIVHENFTEQYINNEQGIRQNFIVGQAPKGSRQLQVRLCADGLKIKKTENNKLLFFRENDNKNAEPLLVYDDIRSWDASGKDLVSSITCQGDEVFLSVDVQNALFPVTIDPLIKNGGPQNANTLLEMNQGQADFGRSVSSAGDVNGDGYSDVIVGAPLYDNGQNDEGAAFIYFGSATGLKKNTPFMIESDDAFSKFGMSVSTAGDVNGDGYSDVVVGAPAYSGGAALLYYGSMIGVQSTPDAILICSTGGSLGGSVALAGDVNGDGYSDVIAGAQNFNHNEVNEGAAFIFYGSPQGISETAGDSLESNQVDAYLGSSVAGAGDVNADGYSDIAVGVPSYTNSQPEEGAVFVYYGSGNGISDVKTALEINKPQANFGSSVSRAGDVNGDGYSDLIVGAPNYSNGQGNEGAACIFLGSPNGSSLYPNHQYEFNTASAKTGNNVSGAGDVNGDGYDDLLIGAPNYKNGQDDEGKAYLCMGKNNITHVTGIKLYNSDLTSPMTHIQFPSNKFGTGLSGRSFLGKARAKLVWETRPNAEAFSANPGTLISNSTSFSGSQDNFADLGLNGVEMKQEIAKKGLNTKIRMRLKYDPVLALSGQIYGPWRYTSRAVLIDDPNSLPVVLVNFNIQKTEDAIALSWTTSSESNSDRFEVQRSRDGMQWDLLTMVPAASNSAKEISYSASDPAPLKGKSLYRLKMIDSDETFAYSRIRSVDFAWNDTKPVIYPNPAIDQLYIRCENPEEIQDVKLLNSTGKVVYRFRGSRQSISLSGFAAGTYILVIKNSNGSKTAHQVSVNP